jgi:hypothetical protein
VDVSVKNLIFWPLMFLLVGIVWAQTPSGTPTATVTVAPIQFPSPTPQQKPTNTASVAPTGTMLPTGVPPPAVRNPVSAAPPGMVYDPVHNSYHYQSRQHP